MPSTEGRPEVELTDRVPGSVRIRRLADKEWRIIQRSYGPEHNNNHNPTWIALRNPGPATKLRVHLRWAESGWMNLRT